MKKFLFIIACLLVSCFAHAEEDSIIGQMLRGDHELFPITGEKYVFIGGLDQKMVTSSTIKFMWQSKMLHSNPRLICEFSYDKVRFIIKDKVVPMVKFRWKTFPNSDDPSRYLENVIYVVITCDRSQITTNLPLEL